MNLKNKMQLFGSIFMLKAILLGAIATHYLERFISSEAIVSFEVGVRYLTYHALALLVLSSISFSSKRVKQNIYNLITLGILLFSGSIFLLSFQAVIPFSLRFLGPITPIGGGFLIIGWCLVVWSLIKKS